jgi:hypothetical protein
MKDVPVSAYAGILTPRTSTTGAERSARLSGLPALAARPRANHTRRQEAAGSSGSGKGNHRKKLLGYIRSATEFHKTVPGIFLQYGIS